MEAEMKLCSFFLLSVLPQRDEDFTERLRGSAGDAPLIV